MSGAQLTARQRAELLSGEFLAGSGAPDGRSLARELFDRLAREGIVLVDEPVRPPIGGRRRYRSRPQTEPASPTLGPPVGVRGCSACHHLEHPGRACRSYTFDAGDTRCSCAGAS